MILLDTNVVSETMRAIPDQRVLHWLDSLDEREAGIPSVVLAKLYYGLDLMADGRRKEGTRLALDSRDLWRTGGNSSHDEYGFTVAG